MLKRAHDHSAYMVEHIFLKKRQRRRKDGFLTAKNIFRIMLVSVLTLAGFLYFIGDPTTAICENGCESEFSPGIWMLGFLIIFGSIILLAALVGALLAIRRWADGSDSGAFSVLMNTDSTAEEPDDIT